MTIKALSSFTPEWYTPASEADDDTPARFKVRGLTGSQQAEVSPEIELLDNEDVKISGRAMFLLLKFGLTDWEGLEDDGGPVRFGKNTKVNQDLLPYPLQIELAGRIFELTYPAPDDKKKSQSRRK